MKVDIRKIENGYKITDEFGLVNEERKTYDEAIEFLKTKFPKVITDRAIFYIHSMDVV